MKYDGKFASRWRAKSPDALCAVSPLIHVGARAAQYKGNAAPGFTPCLPKLLFHKFGGIFSKTQKNCFPAISAENFGFSAAYIFWLSPKSHLIRRVVFLGFSRVGKTSRQHRTKIVRQMRRQIFRQMKQKAE